jgi:AcrR family transcriptional regulator
MKKAPREPRRDPEKQDAILAAALQVFARDGYRGTDVQVVADMAGVGKGTVYRYFGNKKGLFQAVAHAGMQDLERQFHELLEEPCPLPELTRRAALNYAKYFQDHPEYVEIMIQERAEFRGSIPDTHLFYRERNRGRYERLMREGVKDGTLKPVNVRKAGNALANALYGTVVCAVLEGSTRRLRSDVEYTLDLFFDGILARRGAPDREVRP